MAMNSNDLGDAWVTSVLACLVGSPLVGDTDKLRTLMRAMAADAVLHMQNNMDIVLDIADIDVLPGTFTDSLSAPVTGTGVNNAVTLTQKIE